MTALIERKYVLGVTCSVMSNINMTEVKPIFAF